MLNVAFSRFPDRDENFVEQFQTTGFNNRTFEVYVSEMLHSEDFVFKGSEPQPDFHVEKNGLEIFIECTTTNPTMTGTGSIGAYRALPDGGFDRTAIAARREEAAIRVGGALRSKMMHRIGKREKRAYWELPHVQGRQFILAIETFHENGALALSSSSVAEYLYGMRWNPSWDECGGLVVNSAAIDTHWGTKTIKSGFFGLVDPDYNPENVSAVLWTNAGTVPKIPADGAFGTVP